MLLLAPGIPLLLLGLLITLFGLRGKRVDDHPLCRRCRFDLHGIEPRPDVCPECGTQLTGNQAFRFGNRTRRSKTMAVGALMMFVAMVMIGIGTTNFVRGVPLQQQKPLWMLKMEMKHGIPDTQSEAGQEIARRLSAGTVSADAIASLARLLLKRQGDLTRTWDATGEGEILQHLWDHAALGEAQRSRYLHQGVNAALDLACRPRIRSGSGLQIVLRSNHVEQYRFGQSMMGTPKFRIRQALISYVVGEIRVPTANAGSSTSWISTGPGWLGNYLEAPEALGTHIVGASFKMTILDEDDAEISTWLWTGRSTVEVVDASASVVTLIDRPELEAEITSSVREINARGANPPLEHDFIVQQNQFVLSSTPIPTAFDIYCADGETEHWIGRAISKPDRHDHVFLNPTPKSLFPNAASVDIILRSNAEIAERTFDIFEIWDGEIRFEDLAFVTPPLRERTLDDQLGLIRNRFNVTAYEEEVNGRRRLTINVEVNKNLIAGAWRILERHVGTARDLGALTTKEGGFGFRMTTVDIETSRDTVTIILEPDAELAEQHNITDDIWFTEPIEFEVDVVRQPSP